VAGTARRRGVVVELARPDDERSRGVRDVRFENPAKMYLDGRQSDNDVWRRGVPRHAIA
jgi:hypothetical protein